MPPRLIIRPGARYACQGDGTCCTNVHLLGSITRREAQIVRKGAPVALPGRSKPVVEFHKGIKALVLVPEDKRCVFLDRDARCRFHAAVGESEKPSVCRRFPLGATGTPQGIRVSVSHRCPCVSVGDTPLLDETRARASLITPESGRIARDHDAGKQIRWRARSTVSFESYVEWERDTIAQLDGDRRDVPIERVLKMTRLDRLPPLRGATWTEAARRIHEFGDDEDEDDGFFCTMRWASLGLRSSSRRANSLPNRPWAWTFERAAARALKEAEVRHIYGAWLADMLWAMAWSADRSVYRTLADMSARYVLANRLATGLREAFGMRRDLAAAESIMIADTVGESDPWGWACRRLVEAPRGTF